MEAGGGVLIFFSAIPSYWQVAHAHIASLIKLSEAYTQDVNIGKRMSVEMEVWWFKFE